MAARDVNRAALLSAMLTQLEGCCELLRAILADDLAGGQPNTVEDDARCHHDNRQDITTMGETARRELCLVCGARLVNGAEAD